MKCIKCKKPDFREAEVTFKPEVRGTIVEVKVKAFVCSHCGEPLMSTEQMTEMQRASADAYRSTHDLFTSKEIAACRKRLNMSQEQFAKYLGVGSASIARWEMFGIQDKAQDELIKLKCDSDYARRNSSLVSARTAISDVFSGNRGFDPRRLMMMFVMFTKRAKSALYINKAAFYADFSHFRAHKVSITGARYSPMKFGPCPVGFWEVYETAIKEGFLKRAGENELCVTKAADTSIFSEDELKTIQHINELLKGKGYRSLFETSHQEKGFKETREIDHISYKYSRDLLVQ